MADVSAVGWGGVGWGASVGKGAAQEIKERHPVLPATGETCRNFEKLETGVPEPFRRHYIPNSQFVRVTQKSHLAHPPASG